MTLFRISLVALYAAIMGSSPASAAATKINWHDWQPAAFAAAASADKLIMVNVGHEGCTACRNMERNTFSNAEVVALLNEHFISIQVDSEARPDLGERYSDWAWPATVFMRPDASQVLALRGSLRPTRFMAILTDLLQKKASDTLRADASEPYVAPTSENSGPLSDLLDQVRDQLERQYDDELGGWGRAKVLEFAEPTLQFFTRAHLYRDELAAARGLKNAYGFARQFDEVWGGMFYASFNGWDNTVKEKRTESQAAALQIFAAAYQLSGDTHFRERLALIDAYLHEHMRSANGLYFASQKDIVVGARDLDIDAYYALGDEARRAHGLPATDRATYTDLNARVLQGYVRAFEATGESIYRERALALGAALVRERLHADGWFLQLKPQAGLNAENRVHVLRFDQRPFLRTQAYTGRALLALYQITQDKTWLTTVNSLATALRDNLEDSAVGGFYGSPADGTETLIARRKPLEDNAVAAQFLYLLGVLNKDEDLKNAAQRAIRASAAPAIVDREGRVTGNLAVALEMLEAGYVEFSVVGEVQDPAAQNLLNASQRVYEPRKVVHFERPGRYPQRAEAALYICNDDACSLPIADAALVSAEAAKFIPAVLRSGLQ